MSQTLSVKNVARRPVGLEGGRVLAHGEHAEAPDCELTRLQIADNLLLSVPASSKRRRPNPAEEA
jgi:hypothetical protein